METTTRTEAASLIAADTVQDAPNANQIEEHLKHHHNASHTDNAHDRCKLDHDAADERPKQSAAGDLNDPTNRPLSNVDRTELRLLVRRCEAGALIGKRGSNIKRLRETFRTSKISIPDTGNGPERIVCLSIDGPHFEAMLADLTNVLLDKSPDDSGLIEIKLLIHSSHAGSLIGIGGQSIKKLRNDSKAAIKIYEMCCPLSSERVCAVKSKPPVVVRTVKLIIDTLRDSPIKGTIKPYDALNFEPSLADKYGGCSDDCLGPLGDCSTAPSNGFASKFGSQANLCIKHYPCRSSWCSINGETGATPSDGAPFASAGRHHDRHIIADAMPVQVAPIVYQLRAPAHKQTLPISNARGMPLLNQEQQCYDNYAQSKSSFNGVLHGTNRMLANPFRLQTICRPIHSQRFHPYLQARRPECKSYQQVSRPSNLIFKFNRQVSTATRAAANQSGLRGQPATSEPNQQPTASDAAPVAMNIDPSAVVANDVTVQPLMEPIATDPSNLAQVRTAVSQCCSQETREPAVCATAINCCWSSTTQTGNVSRTTLISPSSGCHERPVTNDQTPESTK